MNEVILCKQARVDGPVRVDPEQFHLDQAKPAAERVWSLWTSEAPAPAPAVPVAPAAAPPSPVAAVALPKMLVMKSGTKFLIVDEKGQTITGVEGIEPTGYKTQAAATKAIEALTNA